MKKMRIKIFLLILIFLLLIVINLGCWDKRELDEISIVSAAGVDFGPTEKEITFIYQIINPSAIAGKGISSVKVPFITQKTTGETIFDAIAKTNREISRELYFDHLQIFIIAYDFAKEKGIEDILDGLYRDHEIRENIFMLISLDNKTEEILSTIITLENINGNYIKNILDNAYKNESATRPVELREVVSTLSSATKSLVIPLVDVAITDQNSNITNAQSSKQETVIKVEGFAVFKEDKIIGKLDFQDALALNCITGKLKKTICVISYKGSNHSIEILNSKTEIKADIKNGQPKILIDVKHQANISEINAPIDLSDPEVIKDLEHETNKKINQAITMLIEKVQKEWKVDIFGFGEALERQNPKEWKQIEDDWVEYFTNLKVEVKVNTTIREIGMKNKTFQEDIKGAK